MEDNYFVAQRKGKTSAEFHKLEIFHRAGQRHNFFPSVIFYLLFYFTYFLRFHEKICALLHS